MAQAMSGESQYDGLEAMRLASFDCDGARGCPAPHSPRVSLPMMYWHARSPPPSPPVPPHPVPDPAGSGGILQEARRKPWCIPICVIRVEERDRDKRENTLALKGLGLKRMSEA